MRTICVTILAAAVAAGGLRAAVIEVGPCDGNATPAVVFAAARLRDGDTLRFAPGEKHFHDYLHIRLSAFADILFEGNRLSNGQSVIMVDDLTGYWGECGPVRNLTIRNNDYADMRHTFFDFHVPFTGRAILERNRIRGRNADKPYMFGPGVKVDFFDSTGFDGNRGHGREAWSGRIREFLNSPRRMQLCGGTTEEKWSVLQEFVANSSLKWRQNE